MQECKEKSSENPSKEKELHQQSKLFRTVALFVFHFSLYRTFHFKLHEILFEVNLYLIQHQTNATSIDGLQFQATVDVKNSLAFLQKNQKCGKISK